MHTMKKLLLMAFFIGFGSAHAANTRSLSTGPASYAAANAKPLVQTLKEGKFTCEVAKNYDKVTLKVKQHPTKPNKITLDWQGTLRILHYEPTETGALRYEGAVSKLVYIQTPKHSMLLNNSTMKPVLTDCVIR
jgi:hypothetical protein